MLPIGARMRAKKPSGISGADDVDDDADIGSVKLNDLDAKLKALEDQLKGMGSGDDEDDDGESDSDEGEQASEKDSSSSAEDEVRGEDGVVIVKKGGVYRSRLADFGKIPPLPVHLLPSPMCKGKGSGKGKEAKKAKRKVKHQPEETRTGSKADGLERSVEELLRDYKPASQDRIPFYCRICRFEGSSIDDLRAHKSTDLHKLAEEAERKLSYCKLCRKQFTSPDQLKGHLQGRAHKELLASRMAKRGIVLGADRENGHQHRERGGEGKRVERNEGKEMNTDSRSRSREEWKGRPPVGARHGAPSGQYPGQQNGLKRRRNQRQGQNVVQLFITSRSGVSFNTD